MDQGDLFGAAEPRDRLATEKRLADRIRAEDHKRDARRAKALAEEGMARVKSSTEKALPGWSDMALEKVRRFAAANEQFTVEVVKEQAYLDGLPKPPNESAWGPVMKRASKAGWITFVGFAATHQASRHGLPNRLWKRTGKLA